MMTDSLADMLTRIRNANRIERPAVDIPATKLKIAVAQVLKEEGFILDYHIGRMEAHADERGDKSKTFVQEQDLSKPHVLLRVYLNYGPEGERVIRHIERASRPGRRLYRRAEQLRPVLDGLGISVISTSRGVMSDRKARAQRLGGELLCTVW
jgi:small subunit ribosomal protein S8